MKQHIIHKLSVIALLVMGFSFGAAVLPTSVASAATTKCVNRQFSIANERKKDTCVKYIQQMVNANNGSKLAVDGYYGPKTTAQVRAFQEHRTNLKADGIVGNDTWSNLCASQEKYKTTAKNAGCTMKTAKADTKPAAAKTKPITQTYKRDANRGCDAYTYRQGAKGTCVKYIQQMFRSVGSTIKADGVYGPQTAKAVSQWQSVFAVKGDQSGVLSANTWDSMCFWNGNVPGGEEVSQKMHDNWTALARKAGCNL